VVEADNDSVTANGASFDYQQLIDSITEYGVIRLDEKGLVRTWNPGAQRLKQYTAEEIIGRPITVFYPEAEDAAGLAETEARTDQEGFGYPWLTEAEVLCAA